MGYFVFVLFVKGLNQLIKLKLAAVPTQEVLCSNPVRQGFMMIGGDRHLALSSYNRILLLGPFLKRTIIDYLIPDHYFMKFVKFCSVVTFLLKV